LWPLLMVVLAPVFLREVKLKWAHIAAALVGFAGAAIVIVGGAGASSASASWSWGYLPAIGSAFIWASYSLGTRRVPPFPTAAIGLFGLVSGLLSLLCHALLEAPAVLTRHDWMLVTAMGLGPLGAAFFLWDQALKTGDPRHIGILSYLTPLLSTALLIAVSGRVFSPAIVLAAMMIIGAAVIGTRAR
ncbi:MAG: DMT family transporter, partial [Ramlibacter sp.]|nr:DMT family transporter [Ramlibacter sp.]